MKILLLLPLLLSAQQGSFQDATQSVSSKLEASLTELSGLRDEIAAEQIPLSKQLRELESELSAIRLEYREVGDLLGQQAFDLSSLTKKVGDYESTNTYLENLFGEYIRNLEPRLHIAELQRYGDRMEAARLAPENPNLSPAEVFAIQADLIDLSTERLEEALGGARFAGTAVDPESVVQEGLFLVLGPAALFAQADGAAGTAEQRIGSLEPALFTFDEPELTAAAAELVATGQGFFPFDPTLGNAHKIAATQDSFLEHAKKGGEVMIPIAAMAGLALLLAVFKWIHLTFVRKPSKKKIEKLLEAVADHDEEKAREISKRMPGPTGEMLHAGVAHMKEPRDLIEEVMYEKVLTTKLRLQKFLPFIAICAASAPLLGLLGTVTGIINTFKLITVFGSGDVKMLSGGISEALITTKFGLIVAIPSLLLHAFLSRKAKGVTGQMETSAVAFVNQVSKAPYALTYGVQNAVAQAAGQAPGAVRNGASGPATAAELASGVPVPVDGMRDQIREILSEMLVPQVKNGHASSSEPISTGSES